MKLSDLNREIFERGLKSISHLVGRPMTDATIAEADHCTRCMLSDMVMEGKIRPFGENTPFSFIVSSDTGTLRVQCRPTFAIYFGVDVYPDQEEEEA